MEVALSTFQFCHNSVPLFQGSCAAQLTFYWKLVDRKLHKWAYPLVTRRLGADDVFLNFGYEEDTSMSLQLAAFDETNGGVIQLYHRARPLQADISDKRVLEVGCGRGSGAL